MLVFFYSFLVCIPKWATDLCKSIINTLVHITQEHRHLIIIIVHLIIIFFAHIKPPHTQKNITINSSFLTHHDMKTGTEKRNNNCWHLKLRATHTFIYIMLKRMCLWCYERMSLKSNGQTYIIHTQFKRWSQTFTIWNYYYIDIEIYI